MVPFWGVMRRRSGWFAGGVAGGVSEGVGILHLCGSFYKSRNRKREGETMGRRNIE